MPHERGVGRRNNQMVRGPGYADLTMAPEGLTEAVDFREFSMMAVHMPTAGQGWTAASIGFYVSPTVNGTYQAAYDDDGNLLQIDGPTVGNSYSAPPSIAGFRFVKLWSQDGAGADTAQAQARPITVDLKG